MKPLIININPNGGSVKQVMRLSERIKKADAKGRPIIINCYSSVGTAAIFADRERVQNALRR